MVPIYSHIHMKVPCVHSLTGMCSTLVIAIHSVKQPQSQPGRSNYTKPCSHDRTVHPEEREWEDWASDRGKHGERGSIQIL